jgi:hypothetical protein
MRKTILILIAILFFALPAYAENPSVRPHGISTTHFYERTGGAGGSNSTYYIDIPTPTANDTLVTLGLDQTFTGTLTIPSPTMTGTITAAAITASGDITANGNIVGDGATNISAVLYDSETVAATNVITAAECGKTFYLSHATEFASTLPALSTVSAGCEFEFIVVAAPADASYTVITGNSLENQIFGLVEINGAAVAGVDEDTITFADGAAAKGDWCKVRSDGTSWFVKGQGVAAGAITLTQAD